MAYNVGLNVIYEVNIETKLESKEKSKVVVAVTEETDVWWRINV